RRGRERLDDRPSPRGLRVLRRVRAKRVPGLAGPARADARRLPRADVGRRTGRALLGARPLHQHEQPRLHDGRLRLPRDRRRIVVVGAELQVAASRDIFAWMASVIDTCQPTCKPAWSSSRRTWVRAMTAASLNTDRFPFTAYPSGWFVVATSEELVPGQLLSLRYFGRELVAFRGESGKPSVIDAHCPHLGAHLA